MAKSPRAKLQAVFDADRALRKAEAGLLGANNKELRSLLARAVGEAEKLSDPSEACLRLERLADLCAQAPGAETLDALVHMLDHEDAAVRIQACEALVDVGCERPGQFAAAVKRALKRDEPSPGLQQLPWIIAEIGEPDAEQLIKPFLGFRSAEIAGAAVEALISLATPEAFAAIEPFKDDRRAIELDEDDCGHGVTITIGQLVRSFLAAPRSS
jgi:HEAT repeat protein